MLSDYSDCEVVMLQNLIIVSEQVAILFVLIAVGFVCSKTKLINNAGAKHLTDIALYLATPCIMVQSFQDVKFEESLALNLGICAICSVLIQVVSIFICRPIFRDKNESRKRVLRFAAVFSNCGFMSLPLQKAVIGSKGVFYGAVFVMAFNILVWSFGLVDMSGDKKNLTVKKILINPGVLGAAAAALLFFLKIQLPDIALTPIRYLAALNTPVPMLVIGYHLSKTNFSRYLKDKAVYVVLLLRLVGIPLAALFIMRACGVSGEILIACVIASSAPTAATTTMFATKFGRDIDLSVGLVSSTTVVSIVTMPVIIALAQTIS